MSYYGQYPFNTNGGALLSKRNYINRKLDEIEQKLLSLEWIEPETDYTESVTDEYDLPVESAGALLPYRDKVNKKLDFFEEVINSHIGTNDNYDDYYDKQMNDDYNNNYTSTQPQTYVKPSNNIKNNTPTQTYTKPQEEVKKEEITKNFNDAFSNIFG